MWPGFATFTYPMCRFSCDLRTQAICLENESPCETVAKAFGSQVHYGRGSKKRLWQHRLTHQKPIRDILFRFENRVAHALCLSSFITFLTHVPPPAGSCVGSLVVQKHDVTRGLAGLVSGGRDSDHLTGLNDSSFSTDQDFHASNALQETSTA